MVLLAVALSALTVACSETEPIQTEAEAEPAAIGSQVTMPISTAVTTLIDPGDDPRDVLRADIPPDEVQQVTLRTVHHVQQQINNQGMRDFSPPSVTIPLTARGSIGGVDLTLGTVTSADPALSRQLKSLDGSHAGFDLSAAGAVTALRLSPKPSTPDAARSALEQAFCQAVYQSIAFPDEAVGEGAVWTVRQEVAGDVMLDQVTTATLTRRVDNLLTIALDITQTPKSTEWTLPNHAGSLDIVDYGMHGSGTITVDLSQPLPVAGSVTIAGTQSYRDRSSGVLLAQDLSTQVQWGE
ncbi:hypothetical protein EBN03_27360 [Nocardia stercoris]|uniref:Uncharacterized protein n=2 Tax=Nocardia stercoris TaxID=2483361 RepID=A0A3M2KX20_9NOCA|nr:hypothetical protein EBN03_27360 [Nocardia stercoris]